MAYSSIWFDEVEERIAISTRDIISIFRPRGERSIIPDLQQVLEDARFIHGVDLDMLLQSILDEGPFENIAHFACHVTRTRAESREILRCISNYTTDDHVRRQILNQRRYDGMTPLMLAVQNNVDLSIFDKFTALGASVAGREQSSGYTTLHLAVITANTAYSMLGPPRARPQIRQYTYDNAISILRSVAIIYHDERRSYRDRDTTGGGWQAAHHIGWGGCVDALRILIQNFGNQCVDKNTLTGDGLTVFALAQQQDNAVYRYMDQWGLGY